jgi:hypothetical protein
MERFFWSFLAAVFIFVSGALFSVYEGVHRMLSGEEPSGTGIAFAGRPPVRTWSAPPRRSSKALSAS